MDDKQLTILLVDDDDLDRRAVVRGFRKQKIVNRIVEAVNGEEALAILRGDHPEKSIPAPFLILLDIKMPRMDGFEFLDAIRADSALAKSVVFILTTAEDEHEQCIAYSKSIAGYILKSKAGQDFIDAVTLIDSYWRVVEIP